MKAILHTEVIGTCYRIPRPVIFYRWRKALRSHCLDRIFAICDAGFAVNIDAFKIGEFSW